ncbi:MAG: hypothetical protein KatS3mg114_1272 [Planctomycetaceae bacterium]|nr:MAG: hypothetical protein KatS3mg114_1272 [Planctomycetaceae bacterium]
MTWYRQLVKHSLTACLPREWWLVRGPRRHQPPPYPISLTFDDGPHPEFTPRVLSLLQRWEQRATFFVVGERVERYPELVRAVVAAGHELGNHTYHHTVAGELPLNEWLDEVDRTQRVLRDLVGYAPRWFRPPKGKLTARGLLGLWRRGLSVVLWSADPRDYLYHDRQTLQTAAPCVWDAGEIVLLHDHQPASGWLLESWGQAGWFEHWQSVGLSHWFRTPADLTAALPSASSSLLPVTNWCPLVNIRERS